ncbi:MAG: hypothetical protein ACK5LC_08850 [Coprobacillaceae bacterium]
MVNSRVCRHCCGSDFVEMIQVGYGHIRQEGKVLKSQNLYHITCVQCGTVVRSYIKKLDKLSLKK